MELKPFTPDDKFFDDLVAKFDKEYISRDYRDLLTIRRCDNITVFETIKDSSFSGSADEFVDTFLNEVKKTIEGRNIDQVMVCIIHDNNEPILMETISHLNDFVDTFGEDTEVHWGFCHNEENFPMRLIVAIGNET